MNFKLNSIQGEMMSYNEVFSTKGIWEVAPEGNPEVVRVVALVQDNMLQ